MRTVSVRSEPLHRTGRSYLDLARESVKMAPLRQRRLALTDGPFAETKEKVAASP